MLFRKICENDYEQFLSLINDFRTTIFSKEDFINILQKMNLYSETWVLEKDNELIATGKIIYEHKFIYNITLCGHIEDVCTKKEYRNKGYGKKIIEHLIKEAAYKKCYKIILVCNQNLVNFYSSCGMEERGIQMSFLILN